MSAEQDRELWDALVEAEREHARRRADFYQNAQGRAGILKSALFGEPWQQATALGFLRDFRAPRGALVYRPRSGHGLEEVSVGLMAYLDP